MFIYPWQHLGLVWSTPCCCPVRGKGDHVSSEPVLTGWARSSACAQKGFPCSSSCRLPASYWESASGEQGPRMFERWLGRTGCFLLLLGNNDILLQTYFSFHTRGGGKQTLWRILFELFLLICYLIQKGNLDWELVAETGQIVLPAAPVKQG